MHKAIYVHRSSTQDNHVSFNAEGDQFDIIETCAEISNRNYVWYDILSYLEPEFVASWA
jgi:hypothetical protein